MNPFAGLISLRRHSQSSLRGLLLLFTATCALVAGAQNAAPTPYYRWSTLAGHPTTGFADGPAAEALFNNPQGLAEDTAGNIYVADTANHVIRKISADGQVTTLAGSPGNAGSADGTGSAARFAFPQAVAVDGFGVVYVADTENNTLRKITPAGAVTTVLGQAGQSGDGTGTQANVRLNHPSRIFADREGRVYFFAGSSLRRLTATGVDDIAINLNDPAFYEDGQPSANVTAAITGADWNGNLYIEAGIGATTTGSNPGSPKFRRIIRLSPDGDYTILATTETGTGKPYLSSSVTITRWASDAFGNAYYVTRLISSIIVYSVYRVAPDGSVTAADWQATRRGGYSDEPISLTADSAGHLLHLAPADDAVFKTVDSQLTVVAGTAWSSQGTDGTGAGARFANISGLAVNADGAVIVGDANSSYNVHAYAWAVVRKVTADGTSSVIHANPSAEGSAYTPAWVTIGSDHTIYLGSANYALPTLTAIAPDGSASSLSIGTARNMGPIGIDAENRLLLAEPSRIDRRSATGDWTVLAGDQNAHAVRDGLGTDARFNRLIALTVAANGDAYVLDDASATDDPKVVIRKVTPAAAVTTASANLIQSGGARPTSLALDAKGDFILSFSDDTLRLLTTDGTLYVIGGLAGVSGTQDGLSGAARFYQPGRLTTDPSNTIYVADNAGTTLRRGEFLGYNATITSQPQSLTVQVGATAEFSVTAQGTPEPAYQWYFNNTPISGATSHTLSIPNAQTTNAGSYTVTVSNNLGTVTSNAATLTVTTPNPPPSGGGSGGGSNPPPSSTGGSGGGAPSTGFLALMLSLGLARWVRRNRIRRER